MIVEKITEKPYLQQKMRPLTITVTDFLPLSGTHMLDVADINSATISGPNEAGKSSLVIDAILFALFGKARKRPEGLINDLSDEANVILTFSHQNEHYKADRRIKRGKNQSLILFCGDKDISERLLTNTQKKLDEILGFSYNLLLSTAIAQQDEINFLSVMTPTERERILNEMLCIDQWESKKKKVADIINEYKDLNKDLEENENLYSVNGGDLNNNSNKYNAVLGQLTPKKLLVDQLSKELKEQEEALSKWVENQTIIRQQYIIESRIKDLKDQLNKLPQDDGISDQITSLKEKKKELENLTLEATSVKNSIKESVDSVQKEMSTIKGLVNLLPSTQILNDVPCVGLDIHDSCQLLTNALQNKLKIEQFLNPYEDKDLNSILVLKTDELKKYNNEVIEFEASDKELSKEISKISLEINNLENKLKEVNKKNEINKQLSALNEQLNKNPIETVEFDSVSHQKTKDILGITMKEVQQYELELVKLKTEATNLEKIHETLLEKIVELKEIEANLANYRTLHTAYNEIPTLLFEEAIPMLEQYTNEILEKISPEKRVQLRSFKETKSNTVQKALDVISTTSTGVRDFDDLSGSAKFRQSLALRIALARYNRERNNIDLPLFIVDEGFGSLDTDNVSVMKTMLKDIASHFDLFLMISHLEELKDVFDTQIIVNSAGKGERICVSQR